MVKDRPTNAMLSCMVLIGEARELFEGEQPETDPLGLALLHPDIQHMFRAGEFKEASKAFDAWYADTTASAAFRQRIATFVHPWLKQTMGRGFFMDFVLESPGADRHVLSRPAERDALFANSRLMRKMHLGILLLLVTDAMFYPLIFARKLLLHDPVVERFAQLRAGLLSLPTKAVGSTKESMDQA
mmetsp:Transcript_26762/g.61668  ORF Transcript_26762/g.61668 Transcript_26762/m.61668 type:complete len:186 (+) Transcript_26762:1-558(+)